MTRNPTKAARRSVLADNVIAYATGLEPPRQKLDSVKIEDEAEERFPQARLSEDGPAHRTAATGSRRPRPCTTS